MKPMQRAAMLELDQVTIFSTAKLGSWKNNNMPTVQMDNDIEIEFPDSMSQSVIETALGNFSALDISRLADAQAMQGAVDSLGHGTIQDPEKVQERNVLGSLPLDIPEYTPENMPDFSGEVMNLMPVAGIFAGARSKIADKAMLQKAQEMTAQGADRKQIWEKTGWFNDVDGQWKYEIDDSGMKYNRDDLSESVTHANTGQNWKEGSLLEGLDHPELRNAYRDTDEIRMVDYSHKGNVAGNYREPSHGILGYDPETITLWEQGGYPSKKNVLAHELQHSIQSREGFAGGGNPRQFEQPGNKIISKNWERWHEKSDIVAEMRQLHESPQYQKDLDASNALWSKKYAPKIDALDDTVKVRSDYAKIRPKIQEVFDDYKKVQAVKFPTMDKFEKLNREHLVGLKEPKKYLSPYDSYARLAGEAEARNVQTRMDFTPKQRQAQPPWETLDVPEDELIVRMGHSGPASAEAYHGSAHRFDRFDMSKIGTGEGAQAYGHGLYFAENPKVAKEYIKMTPEVAPPPVRTFKGKELVPGSPEYHAGTLLENGITLKSARKEVKGWIDDHIKKDRPLNDKAFLGWNKTLETLRKATKKKDFKVMPAGNLYKVEIPDKAIEKMIDYDKPLKQQTPEVQKILNKYLPDYAKNPQAMLENPRQAIEDFLKTDYAKNFDQVKDVRWAKEILNNPDYDVLVDGRAWIESQMRKEIGSSFYNLIGSDKGGSLYERLSASLGGQKAASDFLRSKGITGIKYLDQGSRQGGKQTRNLVLFDDNLPEMLERNGEPMTQSKKILAGVGAFFISDRIVSQNKGAQ
jgi:hypothetical protein